MTPSYERFIIDLKSSKTIESATETINNMIAADIVLTEGQLYDLIKVATKSTAIYSDNNTSHILVKWIITTHHKKLKKLHAASPNVVNAFLLRYRTSVDKIIPDLTYFRTAVLAASTTKETVVTASTTKEVAKTTNTTTCTAMTTIVLAIVLAIVLCFLVPKLVIIICCFLCGCVLVCLL